MVEFSIRINHLPVSTQRADGIIISTPTGSTAYALSVGGPMIYPSVPCMLIIPVAPHTLSNRPVVIPENSVIELTVNEIRDAALYFDMQDFNDVQKGDKMVISTYRKPLMLLHPSSHNFFDTLSKKLHWNYMPSDR